MAVLSKEDFLVRLQARIGDDTSDDAMSFIEDITDTFNDLEGKAGTGNDSEWEQKYNDLDKTWREKYKARFFSSNDETQTETSSEETDNSEVKDYDDLFEEREV